MSSSSRPTSPSPVRPSPQRVFSPPPRVRSPPPFAPAPRLFSPPTHNATSPPPPSHSRVVSPPPILNILPSTPLRPSSPDTSPPPLPPLSSSTTTSADPSPKIPGSKSLDAIHEVLETGDGSESESGQKISSNSSSLILPTSPQRKPTGGVPVGGTIQPLEGQRSMTVEVTNQPQAQLAPTTSEKDKATIKAEALNLKSVKSNDTMKPPLPTKPPKKKRSRTANIANTSTTLLPFPPCNKVQETDDIDSSKAEIFAAKVAAVVDANPDSSDSEEAFVYDSSNTANPNPQNPKPSRPAMHSRTPSMTSINSAYTGPNTTYGTVPAGRAPRSSNDEGYNFPTMTRAQGRSLQGPTSKHPPQDENRRRSILPEDSPFTLHIKTSRNTISPQPSKSPLHPSRSSPRQKSTLPRTIKTPKWAQSQFYDGDSDDYPPPNSTVDSASNERLPLLPRDVNGRSSLRRKNYKSRSRLPSTKQQSQIQASYERRRRAGLEAGETGDGMGSKCWPGLAGTAILGVTLLVLTMLTVGFVFQTSRSLEGVQIRNLTNIVVSQEELVMDVIVQAGNPNILPVLMGDTINIDIFARSDHMDDKPHSHRTSRSRFTTPPFWPPWGDEKEPTRDRSAPPKNLTDGPSLLLGTIRTLEAPLSFPPTGFKRDPWTIQKGQMKLVGPATNATDGVEKWKKCITEDFELIVRGTMKYRAPIGGRDRVVAVEWRGVVDPLGNRIWNGEVWVEAEY